MSEVEREALAIIGRIAKQDPAGLGPELNLVADLGFDSAKALELLCDTEDTFSIEVPDEALTRMDTVGDVVEMVRACLRQEAAS